jgi:hypothetical protein
MLCENENTLKIHMLSTSQIGLPILNAEIKLEDFIYTSKILLDSRSEITVVKNEFITRNQLQKDLISTKPVTIKGINSDLSISKKMINLDIMTREGLGQSINMMAYIIETNNDDNDADIILQANLSISILWDPEGWKADEIKTKLGKISINTKGNYMRINETKIQQKQNDNIVCEEYYSKTVQQRPDGIYVVRYPFNKNRALGFFLTRSKSKVLTPRKRSRKKLKIKGQKKIRGRFNRKPTFYQTSQTTLTLGKRTS